MSTHPYLQFFVWLTVCLHFAIHEPNAPVSQTNSNIKRNFWHQIKPPKFQTLPKQDMYPTILLIHYHYIKLYNVALKKRIFIIWPQGPWCNAHTWNIFHTWTTNRQQHTDVMQIFNYHTTFRVDRLQNIKK